MKLSEVKSFLWESTAVKSEYFKDKKLPLALNMVDAVVATLKLVHPEDTIDFSHDIWGEHIYVIINGKSLDVDIDKGELHEEGKSCYSTEVCDFNTQYGSRMF